MKIVSYYTDLRYRQIYERLEESATKHNYTINVVYEPKAITWQAAVRYKPLFLSRVFQKFPNESILYLDADCEIMGSLAHLEYLVDFKDIHLRKRDLEDKYNCGVMLFKNSGWLLPFIKTWRKLTDSEGYNSITVDQKPFEKALQVHSDITIGNLPYQYNYLPHDILEFAKESALIIHHKESKTNDKARNWRNQFKREHRKL